jgi:hypothetical protein
MRTPTIILFTGLLLACEAGSQENPFEALHIERTQSFELTGPPEEVFPLLEPRGRQRWVTNWSFEFLHPPAGEAQPGAVVRQTLRNGLVEQIWLLAEHQPPTRIKYVIFVPGMETWELDTRLRSTPEGKTLATTEHRITSLAPSANAEVQRFADNFDTYVKRLQSSINAALDEER